MYDNRFGMYPSDDMNDNINSYFGESDTNFFADNSNEQVFGEGFSSGFGDCEMITEAMGFSTTDSDIIMETGMDTDPSEKNFSHDKYESTKYGLTKADDDPYDVAEAERRAKPNSTQHRLKALHHEYKFAPDDDSRAKNDAEYTKLAKGQHGSTLVDIHNSGPQYPSSGSPEDLERYHAEHRRLAAEARAKEAAAKKREDEYTAKAKANYHPEEPKGPKPVEEAPKKKKKGFFGLFG